ncbi:MAG: hypothetical protein KAX19_00270 [Candidatus Brocadiae bacterium]|nr:hypothetical protein [Candidatus Brocadiia bacterium]
MEVLKTVLYVGCGIAFVVLVSWLAGRLRGRKRRPREGESRLDVAQRRYEAGEIGERELEEVKRRHLER